jgi:hypothetical protein
MKSLSVILLLLLPLSLLVGQTEPPAPPPGAGSGPATPGGPSTSPDGEASAPDAVAIVSAWVLKGNTNSEQRKNIKQHWLVVAAQQAEEILRNETFKKIIDFVEANRDLFADVYNAMKVAKGSVTTLSKARDVALLQGEILILFGRVGDLVTSTESFTPEQMRVLVRTLDQLVADAGSDFELLTGAFGGLFDEHLSDADRLSLLNGVHANLSQKRSALLQIERYVTYLEVNATGGQVQGLQGLYHTAE